MKYLLLIATLFSGACSVASATCGPPVASVSLSSNVIMPLGDSITAGGGSDPTGDGYRLQIYNHFVSDAISFSFVGSVTAGTILPSQYRHHEGHGGYRIHDISINVDAWLAAQPTTNRVILTIGTNDISNQDDIQRVSSRHSALLDQIHADCPGCIIFASSIPAETNLNNFTFALVNQYNIEVRSNCAQRTFCRFIDGYSALIWPDDFWDNLHPTNAGYDKLGNFIYAAMKAYQ